MKLTDLSVAQLEQIILLVKEKESLQAQLDKVGAELRQLESGQATTANSGTSSVVSKAVKRRSRRRGAMSAAVLAVLETAGKKGMAVKELAAKAKVNSGSLNTWLYTAGKRISGLRKLSPGVFGYKV